MSAVTCDFLLKRAIRVESNRLNKVLVIGRKRIIEELMKNLEKVFKQGITAHVSAGRSAVEHFSTSNTEVALLEQRYVH